MNQNILTFMLLAATTPLLLCKLSARREHRLPYGTPDTQHKYSTYVVTLLGNETTRHCTGTLLSVQWVITTATCLLTSEITHVQYGILKAYSDSQMKVRVMEERRYPHFATDDIDIALIRVAPIFLAEYARFSSVDHSTIMGEAVEYAGYKVPDADYSRQPLMVGEGLVRSCVDEKYLYNTKLFVCVTPILWANISKDSAGGASGGPLFFRGEMIGVIATIYDDAAIYTAIESCRNWIRKITNK